MKKIITQAGDKILFTGSCFSKYDILSIVAEVPQAYGFGVNLDEGLYNVVYDNKRVSIVVYSKTGYSTVIKVAEENNLPIDLDYNVNPFEVGEDIVDMSKDDDYLRNYFDYFKRIIRFRIDGKFGATSFLKMIMDLKSVYKFRFVQRATTMTEARAYVIK